MDRAMPTPQRSAAFATAQALDLSPHVAEKKSPEASPGWYQCMPSGGLARGARFMRNAVGAITAQMIAKIMIASR